MIDPNGVTDYDRRMILRGVRRKRREWEKDKKRIARQMRKLEKELDILYPNPRLTAAINLFRDEDVVWRGDIDLLRHPIADVLEKMNACGLFVEEANLIAEMILLEPAE
jgi:hypothetical protein